MTQVPSDRNGEFIYITGEPRRLHRRNVVSFVLWFLEGGEPPLSSNPRGIFPPIELTDEELQALKEIEHAIRLIWLRHYPQVKPQQPLSPGEDPHERVRRDNLEAEAVFEARARLARTFYVAVDSVEPLDSFSTEERRLLRRVHELLQRFPADTF